MPCRDCRDKPGNDNVGAPVQKRNQCPCACRAAAISSTSLCGMMGTWAMCTPNGVSASSTAEMIAAAAGMVPTSPTPFTPSGLSGEGVSLIERRQHRQLGRGRQQVVREGGGERLAAVVVAHPFEQRVADPVRDAAMDLAVDDHRIDQVSGILQRVILDDAHLAGLHVDLDLGHVAAVGVGQIVDAELPVGLEPRLDAGREAVAGRAAQDARELAELDRELAARRSPAPRRRRSRDRARPLRAHGWRASWPCRRPRAPPAAPNCRR